MNYRPPNGKGARHCPHDLQSTVGSNQHQLRVICTRCECHLAIIWTGKIHERMKQNIIAELGGVRHREVEIHALRGDLKARDAQITTMRADMENMESKIHHLEAELAMTREKRHIACCRRRRPMA